MIFLVFIALICLFWIIYYLKIATFIRKIPVIDEHLIQKQRKWPKLSVIIAARNEEKTIEPAIKTLLSQNYPNLNLIVVNDRSTDKTSTTLKRLQTKYSHLQIIQIHSLPVGWLGKVHALHSAYSQAKGDWLLFTDADIHFAPDILKKSISYAMENHLDHFTIAPYMYTKNILLKAMFLTFGGLFYFFTLALPKRFTNKSAVGIGAFNLIRKSALDKTPGFPWLKMEVADDMGLALMLKQSGAKSSFATSTQEVSITWYDSVREMIKGLEKNIFGVASSYHITLAFLQFILGILFSIGPILAIFSFSFLIQCLGILAIASFLKAIFKLHLDTNEPLLPLLFIPIGQILLVYALLRAGILCCLRGGIMWRGTLYKTIDLKAGQRIKLGI